MDDPVKIVLRLKDATLVKWLKMPQSPVKNPGVTSAKLEENLEQHISQIPFLIEQIHDQAQAETNLLKDEEDQLTIRLIGVQRDLDDLRRRSERVERHRPTE